MDAGSNDIANRRLWRCTGPNCMREIIRALVTKKPIIALLELDEKSMAKLDVFSHMHSPSSRAHWQPRYHVTSLR